MTESIVMEFPLPDITLEEVFRAEGADYSKRSPNASVVRIHNQVLDHDARLARPTAIWRELAISSVGKQELILENGQKLNSSLLVEVAGNADKLVLFAMTIGSALDNAVTNYNQTGQILEAFALDAVGSVFLTKSIKLAVTALEERYKEAGLNSTFLVGPGHPYWSGLEDIRTIIETLNANQIGIHLTDSNVMIPRQSVAFVMGVGENLPNFQGKIHCDFCSLHKTCNMFSTAQHCGV